jgi:hypothetical protein
MLLKPEDEERLGVSNAAITGYEPEDSPIAHVRPKPIIVICVAALRGARREAAERLLSELTPQCHAARIELFVHHDYQCRGSLEPWLHTLRYAVKSDATHVCSLPDDAILVPHFVEVLLRVLEAKPEHLLCFQSNHRASPDAAKAGARWYTTDEGWTGFGGTFPIAWAREHLEWREKNIKPGRKVAGDEGVNLWAMMTRRITWKSLPSLVSHDLSLESVDGNDHHEAFTPREPLVWDGEADLREVDWSGPVAHLGRTYTANHWRLTYDVNISAEVIERAYEVDRGGPVSKRPMVALATPSYRKPAQAYKDSKKRVIRDLAQHGIAIADLDMNGDSLVTRARHCTMHEFLRSPATHLLFWDDDVEACNPECVREMVATGKDIVGGAYPFRDGSGDVVANPLVTGAGRIDIEDGCMAVREIGTGFLMVSRQAIVDLCVRNPDAFYLGDIKPYVHHPMWALFDSRLEDRGDGIKRYASEDWWFCRLARNAGYQVYAYMPPSFRHWGEHGHEGHIATAWGMKFQEAAE